MNASTQLALMVKAKGVFESEGTFLSFPALTPISFLERDLCFSGRELNVMALSQFSQLVNRIPEGILFQGTDDTFLWDVYSELLRKGELADITPSPALREAYERALGVLHVTDEDGSRHDSGRYAAYRQHRDAWIAAGEAYRMAKLTAETSDDPDVRARWESSLEKELRREVQEAEFHWAGSGFRAEVEEAEQAVSAYLDRPSAVRTWQEWREAFNPDIDTLTDPASGQSIAPTAFSPADAFDQEWPEFTLDAGEIAHLNAEAPAELRAALDPGDGDSQVERVTFHYRSVGLTRPWLRSEVFRSRFWRLPQGEPPLSLGSDELAGRCPAYVCGVVFARGIAEVKREQGGSGRRLELPVLPRLALRSEVLAALQPQAGPALAAAPGSAAALRRAARQPEVRSETVRALRGRLGHLALEGRPVARRLQPVPPRVPDATVVPVPPAVSSARGVLIGRLARSAFTALPGRVVTPATPSPPPTPGRTEAETPEPVHGERSVSILAVVCKRLPRCPDPDPGLNWPT